MNISDYLSTKAKTLRPYTAGLQPQEPGWIKLNTNENPYPPSPNVYEAIQTADIAKLCLYPDGDSSALRQAIADGLNAGTVLSMDESVRELSLTVDNIFCGNGSDEVLALAFQAFFSGKTNVHTPDISYGFYPVWGKMYDVGLTMQPVNDDFSINIRPYKDASGVIIANPNAPTSLALGLEGIEQILQQNPKGVVLVDEAYIDFANVQTAVSLIKNAPNLLIVRTFSKSHSLAGMRVGYAIGHLGLIAALRLVRDAFNSYPLDMLSQKAATVAIKDRAYLAKTIENTITTRNKTTTGLQFMGYRVLPSQTNFILMETPLAGCLYDYLLQNKILVRYWNTPRLANYLRVTIGTNTEMEAFLQCVQEFTLAKQGKQT